MPTVSRPATSVAADLIHGEGGDDVVLGETDNDVLFGGGQDDTIIGGNGNDRIYGGSGDDRILGDNGYFNTSRNGMTEPLYDLTTPNATNVLLALPGPYTQALTFQAGDFFSEARLFDYVTDPTLPQTGYADIIYGGPRQRLDPRRGRRRRALGRRGVAVLLLPDRAGIDPARAGASTRATRCSTTRRRRSSLSTTPTTRGPRSTTARAARRTSASTERARAGQKVDFFLNFTPYVLDANGTPVTDATGAFLKSNDGCDIIYGDNGNDWIVGGTDTNWLFGGFGDDLLQTSQDLETDGEHNRLPEPALWSEPVFAFGGAGRDVLIAATGRARLEDWTGEFNSFIVPFSPFGEPVVEPHCVDPWHVRDFIEALLDQPAWRRTRRSARVNTPLDELGDHRRRAGPYWNDQHGGPRDPQPGNVPAVRRSTTVGNWSTSAPTARATSPTRSSSRAR